MQQDFRRSLQVDAFSYDVQACTLLATIVFL